MVDRCQVAPKLRSSGFNQELQWVLQPASHPHGTQPTSLPSRPPREGPLVLWHPMPFKGPFFGALTAEARGGAGECDPSSHHQSPSSVVVWGSPLWGREGGDCLLGCFREREGWDGRRGSLFSSYPWDRVHLCNCALSGSGSCTCSLSLCNLPCTWGHRLGIATGIGRGRSCDTAGSRRGGLPSSWGARPQGVDIQTRT